MFHMGTPPSTLPEAFEVCTSEEEELELQWCRVVQEFPLTENELSEANVRGDGWQTWHELEFLESESDVQVRMVQEPQGHDDDEWVILDSGADLSLLPQRLRGRGKPIDVPNLQVSDAQGGSLPIRDMRRVALSTEWSDLSGVMIQEDFAVTNVKSILLRLGKLLKKGWHLEKINPVDGNNSNNQSSRATMQLTSPCGNYGIPVFYRRNSLAIRCQVCEVQAEDKEAKVCEIFVELPEDVDRVEPGEWSVIQEDRVYGPVFRKTSTQKFMNPSYWMQAWPYRATLIRKKGEGNRWTLVELCDKMADLLDPFGKIPQAKEPVESITPLHVVKIEEPEMVGKVLEMTKMFEQERNDDESRDIFKELMEDYEPQGNVEPVPKGGGLEEKTELKTEDKLQLGDLEISKDSSQKVLKEAAEHLGLSKAGSKEKIWKRICEFQKEERLKDALVSSGKLRRELEGPRPQGPLPVKQPTEEERKRREVTRLPYQPWCEECVKCRAKADKVLPADPSEVERHPCVQGDFMFTKGQAALVLICSQTRYGLAVPVKGKTVSRKLAEEIVRFSLFLNHLEECEFVMDSEPATISLSRLASEIRQQLGYKTLVRHAKDYEKGRTAKVERFIQTVRRHASTLVEAVMERTQLEFPSEHAIRAWAVKHSVFLLNRSHFHHTLRSTPFFALNGYNYTGKLLCFGEVAFGLKKPVKKGGALWIKGVWLGKNNQDANVLATKDGIFTTSSVRKSGEPWEKELIFALDNTPWSARPARGKPTMVKPDAPGMIKDVGPGPDESASDPDSLEGYSPSEGEPNGPQDPKEREEKENPVQMDMLVDTHVEPLRPRQSEPGVATSGPSNKRPAEIPLAELADQGNTDEPLVVSGQAIVGQVEGGWEHVELETVGGEEDDEEWMLIEDDKKDESTEGGKPPEVSDEELERLDEAAARKEVEKLKGMGVIEEITRDDSPQGAKWLTLKNVYDWRFRSPGNGEPERWLRRCRIVCREFKTTTGFSAETFAPTSGLAAIKLMVVLHCVLRLLLWTLDCADAFLQVPQQEPCVVEIPVWIRKLLGYTQEMIWHLKRCLPGQRNAGLRWFDYLKDILMPTIMRHVTRRAYINVHVDDELLAANKEDGEWVIAILSQKLTLKINGPYPEIADKEMLYLKKIFKFVEEGVLVLPNGKYFEALEKLTGLSSSSRSFKPKPTPDHTGVGKPDSSKELTGEECSRYRSVLGVLLYLCQERPDVQYAVKNLASYLKTPTEAATTFAKQTVKYLLGTKDYGILYPYGTLMSNTVDRINSPEAKDTSKVPTVEVFTDSDWGGSAKDRSSTSSGMVFVCSCLVSSWSRTQKSIALSSCEAELVAATIGAAEGILIREVLKFVLNQEVHLDVRMDSSSARQWLQRSGIGRLKHLAARSLWLQNAVKEKELFLKAIPTQYNLSDLNTKRLTRHRREMLMRYLPMVFLKCTFGEDWTGRDLQGGS